MSKKYGHSPINFQISLFTYKLDSQYKNYIYKIKKHKNIYIYIYIYFATTTKKKVSSHSPTKTFPKKYRYSPIDFQISLFTYKLDSQYKNHIYKKIK